MEKKEIQGISMENTAKIKRLIYKDENKVLPRTIGTDAKYIIF